MINLLPGYKLQMKLSSTGAPHFHGSVIKTDLGVIPPSHVPTPFRGALNATTFVDVIGDPGVGFRYALQHFYLQMLAARDLTIRLHSSTTDDDIVVSLDSGDIVMGDESKLYFLASDGSMKGSGGGGSFNLTFRDDAGSPLVIANVNNVRVPAGVLVDLTGGAVDLLITGGGPTVPPYLSIAKWGF